MKSWSRLARRSHSLTSTPPPTLSPSSLGFRGLINHTTPPRHARGPSIDRSGEERLGLGFVGGRLRELGEDLDRVARAAAASGLVLRARTSHTLCRSPTSIAAPPMEASPMRSSTAGVGFLRYGVAIQIRSYGMTHEAEDGE